MKKLRPFGVAGCPMKSEEDAIGMTYTNAEGVAVPTPLVFPQSPFNYEIRNQVRNVLEIGAGTGRNVESVLSECSNAQYVGIEPSSTMRQYFEPRDNERVLCVPDFSGIPDGMRFDLVLSTFVFQHIGYRPSGDTMNVADITRAIMRYTKPSTIWYLFEHDREEAGWLDRWLKEFGFNPEIDIRNSTIPAELTERGAYHHLVMFRQERDIDSYTGEKV